MKDAGFRLSTSDAGLRTQAPPKSVQQLKMHAVSDFGFLNSQREDTSDSHRRHVSSTATSL